MNATEHERLIAELVNEIERGYENRAINADQTGQLYFVLVESREYLYRHGWSRGADSHFQKTGG